MVAPSADPVRWGILGAANIGVRKVIPAMQRGERSVVLAIASRDLAKAQAAATELGIARAYGSYEELLADPEIEAIYNPLPNHLHVPWTIRAAEAGKHVLCEKPIALSASEARQLLDVCARTGMQIGEAFMVRNHPQWLAVKELVASGRIGELRVVAGHFASARPPASGRAITIASTPSTNDPVAFTRSVPTGNTPGGAPPARRCTQFPIDQRATPPAALPSAT